MDTGTMGYGGTPPDEDYKNNRIAELESKLDSCKKAAGELMKIWSEQYERVEADNKRLRDAIQNWLDGNYPNPSQHRPGKCPHGTYYWESCNECEEAYWEGVIKDRSE